MPFLARRRQQRTAAVAAEQAAQDARRRQAETEQRRAEAALWDQNVELLEFYDVCAGTFTGEEDASAAEVGLMLNAGEHLYRHFDETGLVEIVQQHGHVEGRSRGVSVRIMRGVTYRVGQSEGQFVPGSQGPQVVDVGECSLTNSRIVFRGDARAEEVPFSKMLGWEHRVEGFDFGTTVQVKGRRTPLMIIYRQVLASPFRFFLELALAEFRGDRSQVIQDVQRQLAELKADGRPGGGD